MKKGLLGSTALIGATALMAGVASAAEAPTWKLTGNANFQLYWVDADNTGVESTWVDLVDTGTGSTKRSVDINGLTIWDAGATGNQDHGWYFGVDEAELQLNVSGTADNGLNYGFKIEINANTTDTKVADEVRLQFSGGWGTVQMGDEDGAEDIMNYGGENLMGATGGFDGDYDDVLIRAGGGITHISATSGGSDIFHFDSKNGNDINVAAPSYPTIAGDTSDHTKVSYFSPRFSGFQVGASITPTSGMDGDEFKADSSFENHIGLGANYDNSFGDLRIRASAVYSHASNADDEFEDISAWSVGGIVGFGPFSLGANYTDNGDSGQPLVWDDVNSVTITAPVETSYWNVAASFETGPMYFSAGYMSTLAEVNNGSAESTFEVIALTADYTIAPGLSAYAEIDMISDELLDGTMQQNGLGTNGSLSNDTTLAIVGMNISF